MKVGDQDGVMEIIVGMVGMAVGAMVEEIAEEVMVGPVAMMAVNDY